MSGGEFRRGYVRREPWTGRWRQAGRTGQAATVPIFARIWPACRHAFLSIAASLLLVGCADQSEGAALNACRLQYFLLSPPAQGQLIQDCMKARSFEADTACSAPVDDHEWDWQVKMHPYDNPRCYRPIGFSPWLATALSAN